jgi:hypothetical protein
LNLTHCQAGTCTLQEAPICAWGTNEKLTCAK